jgi:hypothetical protein
MPNHIAAWIARAFGRREDILSGPFPMGMRVLFRQSIREIYLPETFLEILVMKLFVGV